MKRPWQVWLVFGACVVAAAVAMAGLTRQALEADRLRRAAVADAELEQRVSLALWRMDTELAPLVAAEIVRPPEAYRAADWAAQVPAPNGPSQRQVDQVLEIPQMQQQAVQIPAPQSIAPPPYVLLQFEARPDGGWVSPQMSLRVNPDSPLAQLSREVDLQQLLARLPSAALPSLAAVGDNLIAQNSAKSPNEFNKLAGQINFFEGNRGEVANESFVDSKPLSKGEAAYKGKEADLQMRGQRYQTAAQQSLLNQQRAWSQSVRSSPFDSQEEQLQSV